MADLSLCMGDNLKLLKVLLDDMFCIVYRILALMGCPIGSDRGDNSKCLVIKVCGIVTKCYDI